MPLLFKTKLSRRTFTFMGASASLLALSGCDTSTEDESVSGSDAVSATSSNLTAEQLAFSVGEPEAPVLLQEFLSLTCPYCAEFHKNAYPAIKQNYVDTGKVLLVYRHFPLDGLALRGHMLISALPPALGVKLMGVLLEQQSVWINREGDLEALSNLARLAGLSPEQIEATLNNEALMNSIIAERQSATTEYGVGGTPSFVIGTDKFNGGNFDEIPEWIDGYLA